MTILLYRKRLSLTSGAGQLIRMQAEGLQAAGEDVVAACERGALKFRLATRLPVKRITAQKLNAIAASPGATVVDHQMAIPDAHLVFVHNVTTEAARHVVRPDGARAAAQEAQFFAALRPETPIVANSLLVKQALVQNFGLQEGRITVQYPGFRSGSFRPHDADRRAAGLRAEARGRLGVAGDAPLIGFVTSGQFDKRGLDIFLDAAERIAAARPDARFLVVGAKRLPRWAGSHALVSGGLVHYRPKGGKPERWFSALDIFLYPARFEEFGMVVSEAQASGLPVLTSRRVGAAECLPAEYGPWLLAAPDAAGFAAKTLALLDDDNARRSLAAAAIASIGAFDREHYVRRTLAIIRDARNDS